MKQTFNELTLEELVAKREELSGKMRDGPVRDGDGSRGESDGEA
jgi:hypothetical protein